MRSLSRASAHACLSLIATVAAGCAAADVPSGEEAERASAVSSEIRKCPETDPDYPTCVPEPTHCAGATATLTAAAPHVPLGQSTTLAWSVRLPTGCSSELLLDSKPIRASGTQVVTPLYDSTHRITLGGKSLASAPVAVDLPSTVRIDGNTWDHKYLFRQAIGTANRRVVLTSNVDMDLTGFESLAVARGVTITSEAPPLAYLPSNPIAYAPASKQGFWDGSIFANPPMQRNAKNLGPRVYTSSKPRPLFLLRCNAGADEYRADNVRFAGFRIQGPHQNTEAGQDNLERGIQVDACLGVEIDNMEISGWSGQGVYIQDNAVDASDQPVQRQTGYDAVKVHDSFFHNNQHEGGDGYGVETGPHGHATFEHNLFDLNRHAIASSGADRTSYRASENLFLKGGGVHDKWYKHFTHIVDVHGDDNCGVGSIFNDSLWNCGHAGTEYKINDNAFQFSNDLAIHIRGVPRYLTTIEGNVFPESEQSDAVETYSSENVDLLWNQTGVDTFGLYGVCDLDADGKDDLFLPTGASWWYMSSAKMQWVFLASRREGLADVGLGDFDGDGQCDVFTVRPDNQTWEIAKGGKTRVALPGAYPFMPREQLAFGDFNGDHVTDIFRRAPDGQWSAVSPGRYGWTPLQSSGFALSDLRFGDFDGDGITDVMSNAGGHWSVSKSARAPWAPMGSGLGDEPKNLFVADVDGTPGDDLVRIVVTSPLTVRWDVSSSGRTPWTTLASFTGPTAQTPTNPSPASYVRTYLGRFAGLAKADVLALDSTRISWLTNPSHSSFVRHGLYPY